MTASAGSGGGGGMIWQTPYVNIFKHFGVGKWKKCSKDGDVTAYMDRDMKATVFKVGGSVPANNYIQLPKSSSQSLGLTGSFFYLLFRPLPAKYFVVHLEVVTPAAMVIRISFSNLFREFKSTSTWLQFPYRHHGGCSEEEGVVGGARVTSSRDMARWMFLCLDLREILSKYLSTSFCYVRNIKLCANMVVKNAFTSNIEYSPLEMPGTTKARGGTYLQPVPRDMSLALPKGVEFHDIYNYVRFPCDNERFSRQSPGKMSRHHQPKLLRGVKPGAVLVSVTESGSGSSSNRPRNSGHRENERTGRRDPVPTRSLPKSPGAVSQLKTLEGGGLEYYVEKEDSRGVTERRMPGEDGLESKAPYRLGLAEHKEAGGSGRGRGGASGERVRPRVSWCVARGEKAKDVDMEDMDEESGGEGSRSSGRNIENRGVVIRGSGHGLNAKDKDKGIHVGKASKETMTDGGSWSSKTSYSSNPRRMTDNLNPDPILKLNKVIGFGGVTTSQALFVGNDGGVVVFPCHSLVVLMGVESGKQRFFAGHTRKVACIALNQDGSMLASGQTGSPPVVRVWEVETGRCLGLFQTQHRELHSLDFSASGCVLCGVGRNFHGKTQVVLWRTNQMSSHGDMEVLSRAHTEASIEKMRISGFDDTRMVSCGWDNVRFWRVKDRSLRSCPVNLADHHQMHFTDVQFQPGYHRDSDLGNRNVYACTTSGHMFEIHYQRISISRVWHLVPGQTLHCLALHEAFCVTGSEDGILRVWPMDFSTAFMEAQHEGEVKAVDVSGDGFKVLAGTSVGNLGVLDASSQKYCTVMRSHSGHVTSMSVSKVFSSHLVSCSQDKTIRVWNLPECVQSYDFRLHGDSASSVGISPRGGMFACGFASGMVRLFKLPSTDILSEHKTHGGLVNGLLFSSNGHRLYSSSFSGSLALFSLQEGHTPRVLRLLGNIVAKGTTSQGDNEHTPTQTLALSENGLRLAVIGPLNFTITVLDAENLNEVLRLDITPVVPLPDQSKTSVDRASLVAFSPGLLDELVVVTRDARLLKFCASSGRLLSEVPRLHKGRCCSLAVSLDGRHIVTAGEDHVVKVWSYVNTLELGYQLFVGHSGPVTGVCFTSDGRHLITCGDAIFMWDFLAAKCQIPPLSPLPTTIKEDMRSRSVGHTPPSGPVKATPLQITTPPQCTPPRRSPFALPAGLRSALPRKQVPAPTTCDPLKMQVFSPMSLTDRSGGGMETAESSVIELESRLVGIESRSVGKKSKSAGMESRSVGKKSKSTGMESRLESKTAGVESRSVGIESRLVGTESAGVESRSVGLERGSSLKKPVLDIENVRICEEHKTKDEDIGEDPIATGRENFSHHKNTATSDLVGGREGGRAGSRDTRDKDGPPFIARSSPSSTSSSSSSVSSSLFPISPPMAAVHQKPRPSRCGLDPQLYIAPPEDVGIKRQAAWGLNNCARENLVWHPDTGLFAYGSGCLAVLEDLSSGEQKHFEGHVDEVNCLCVQHDGRVLAAASLSSQHAPCQIRVWDVSSTKCIKVLAFHGHAVQSLSYSRDDRLLLSIGNYQDGSLAVWGTWDYSLLAATSLSHSVHAHCWDPFVAYEFVTVGAWDGVGGVNFWMVEEDMGGKKCQLKIYEPDLPEDLLHMSGGESSLEFTCVCYGAQPLIFVGSNNGVVSMWEGVGNTCLLFWRTESCELSCLSASMEGKLLVGTVTGTLQLWSIKGNATPSNVPPRVTLKAKMDLDFGRVTAASFNKNMELGVVGSSSGLAWYINWPERSKLKMVGGHSAEVTATTFSADSSHLASAGRDGTVAVWKVWTREQLVAFRDPRQPSTCVAFAPPPCVASHSLTKGRDGSRKRGKRRGECSLGGANNGGGGVKEGSTGKEVVPRLVAGYGDGSLRVFDAAGARVVKKVRPHEKEVRAVTYSHDGGVILSGCSGGIVAVSSPVSGLVVRVISDHRDSPITDLQVAARPIQLPCLGEGQRWLWLVASGDRRVSVWSADWQRDLCELVDWLTFPGPPSAPDGTLLRKGSKCQYELLPPSLARFSPCDPDIIIYTGYGLECCVQFYSLSEKTVLRTAALPHWATALDVSPQGHLLAFGCHERVLKLMDYEEGSYQDFAGHQGCVGSLCFSPSGKHLVSSSNSTIQQWTVMLH